MRYSQGARRKHIRVEGRHSKTKEEGRDMIIECQNCTFERIVPDDFIHEHNLLEREGNFIYPCVHCMHTNATHAIKKGEKKAKCDKCKATTKFKPTTTGGLPKGWQQWIYPVSTNRRRKANLCKKCSRKVVKFIEAKEKKVNA